MKAIYLFGERMLERLLKEQVNGQKQKKEENFDQYWGKKMPNIFQDMKSKEDAINAKKNIYPKQNLENSATIIAKLKHLGKEEVFATTTTSGIFLANGVIVTNCDALRYGVVSIPEQHFQQYEPEIEISKNKFTGY